MAILIKKNKTPELLQKNKTLIYRQNVKSAKYESTMYSESALYFNVVEAHPSSYSENNSGISLKTERPTTSKLNTETFMSPFQLYINEEDEFFSTIVPYTSSALTINVDGGKHPFKMTKYSGLNIMSPDLCWESPIIEWVNFREEDIAANALNIQTSYTPLELSIRGHESCYVYNLESSVAHVERVVFKETTYDKFKIDLRSNDKPVYIDNVSYSSAFNIETLKNKTIGTSLDLFIETEDKTNLKQQENYNGKELIVMIDEFTELKNADTNVTERYEWSMGPITNVVSGDATGLETINIEMQKNTFCRYTFKFSDTYIVDIKGLPPGLTFNQTTIYGSASVAGDYMCSLELNNGNELGLTINVPGVRRLM